MRATGASRGARAAARPLALRSALALAASVLAAEVASASGHGPVYGLATPTLGRGGWSLDLAAMSRLGDRDMVMLRPMLAYGITEDLQVSVSPPIPLSMPAGLRPTRTMAMMPANRDVELAVGWRLQRRGLSVGARFETTAYAGLVYPTGAARAGARTAPGLYGALVTGYASRSVYAWVGGLFRRYGTPTGGSSSQPGDLTMYSVVLGYRPAPFRKDWPHPDWRVFVEVVGEHTSPDRVAGVALPHTGGHQIFVGPTLLGLYGAWGVSGGPLFRVHDGRRSVRESDSFRVVVNFTRWF